MLKHKSMKSHGKLKLSQYFQEFKNGDKVAVIRELSLNPAFPIRLQGRTGTVMGMKGNSYIIKIQFGGRQKIHVLAPMHLKKLVSTEAK